MIRRVAGDRRGGVAAVAAIGGALACVATATAVDGGSVALHARRMQAAADLAALAAVRDLQAADAAASATVRANVEDARPEAVEVGVYVADATLAPAARFRTAPVSVANAARVTVSGPARLRFAGLLLGRPSVTVSRRATATLDEPDPLAAFSIGSRLARLDGGVANAVLGALAGGRVSLTAMDYRALADTKIDIAGLGDALRASGRVTAAGPDAVWASEIAAADALRALAAASDGADAALDHLARAVDGRRLKLGDLIHVDPHAAAGLRGGAGVRASALDIASAMLEVAGGGRQAALDVGRRPGLAEADVWLAIGERPARSPWMSVARDGSVTVRTAQTRLLLDVRSSQRIAGLAQVRLPLLIELAASEARLRTVECAPRRAVIDVRPGVARAWIGQVDRRRLADFRTPLPVESALLIEAAGLAKITASGDVEAADAGFTPLAFDEGAIDAGQVRTVQSRGFPSGLMASLLARTRIDARVLGLGLSSEGVTAAAAGALAALGPQIDDLVADILRPAGLSFGEADVVVNGVLCADRPGAPVLVG